MGDDERRFLADYSKRASKCQDTKCKGPIDIGSLRLGRVGPSPFGDGDMKQYFHPKCMFETLKRARAATRVIESADDIADFEDLKDDDKKTIVKLIKELAESRGKTGSPNIKASLAKKPTPVKTKPAAAASKSDDSTDVEDEQSEPESSSPEASIKFEQFQQVCDSIAATSSHLEKTAILKKFIDKQKTSKNFIKNVYTFYKLLLPTSVNRVYNLDSKQLVKVFSQIFSTDLDEMNEHLNKGDVSETIKYYFKRSNGVRSAAGSSLACDEIDSYLDDLTKLTKEADQVKFLTRVAKRMNPIDMRMFVRLIKKDLRIDAGQKVILESISANAYQAYQASRDLQDVIKRSFEPQKPGQLKKDISIRVNLMTPVKPMLAEACKSAEQAFTKCKNGILAEVKYDGERLQVHKHGDKFTYFSRNLKQVSEHKTAPLKQYIPKAMPGADQLILDGEILLYDTKNKCPLPFGTLGKHKKNKFQDATVCYFVFDCLYYNGESLMNKTMKERREILENNVKEIPGRIMLSEQKLITEPQKLKNLMLDAIKKGLEGLVLKDTKSVYEPGKRHWLKMKKDYLESGSMADTADLVVLGAYYGTGAKGGMKSTFLMGCLNEKTKKWHTVTKVANGFDDKTLDKLQKSIDMVAVKKNEANVNLPGWLVINKTLIPDFVVKNPEKSPVWELTGAEFSKSDKHTADGISIRFPRVTKQRHDKSWKEATSLQRLKELFAVSKQKSDIVQDDDDEEEEEDEKMEVDEEVVEEKKQTPTPKRKLVNAKKRASSGDESEEEVKVVKKVKQTSDNPSLPDIFKDKTFCVMPNVDQAKELKRYIFAYGGEIVDEKLADKSTHVVLNDSSDKMPDLKKGSKVEKITREQLWDAIKRKKF